MTKTFWPLIVKRFTHRFTPAFENAGMLVPSWLRAGQLLLIGSLAVLTPQVFGAEPAEVFPAEIRPLLTSHCVRCHGGEATEGDVNLARLTDDAVALRAKKLLKRALAQIESGEMPPADEKQFSADERQRVTRWLQEAIKRPAVIDEATRDPGRAVIHRLTRTEYNNTVRDLLGVDFDVASAVGMPDESVGHGFDNLGEALKLQALLLEKYFAAADKTLERFSTPVTDDTPRGKTQEAQRQAAYQRIFFVQPGGDLNKRQAARQVMQKFLLQAYRRPVSGTEVERYLKVYEAAGGSQAAWEEGVKAMLKAALVSPNFLLRIEENRAPMGSKAPYQISDYELASRLSYFLWSSMPDDTLFELAEQKQLSKPEVLDAQVQRMLADPKAKALSENFAAQWLQLRRLPSARPSIEFFPTLTPQLRAAMAEETTLLFDSLRTENGSLLTLLNANYTYLNGPLAEHYGLPGIEGEAFRRVALPGDSVRGGLLGMASVLTLNSHTFRTSPTMRGKWILEVVFGTPPPPPPANVSQIKEEEATGKEPQSFREVLARHAGDASCAGCHKKIDPLGFGLENFDAIGRWRDNHGGTAIDASGVLPSGEKFVGPRELKAIVLRRQDDFVRNLAEKMLVYALGRELEYHDEVLVDNLMVQLVKDDYRFATLVRGIASSYAMGHRRNLDDKEWK